VFTRHAEPPDLAGTRIIASGLDPCIGSRAMELSDLGAWEVQVPPDVERGAMDGGDPDSKSRLGTLSRLAQEVATVKPAMAATAHLRERIGNYRHRDEQPAPRPQEGSLRCDQRGIRPDSTVPPSKVAVSRTRPIPARSAAAKRLECPLAMMG